MPTVFIYTLYNTAGWRASNFIFGIEESNNNLEKLGYKEQKEKEIIQLKNINYYNFPETSIMFTNNSTK